MEFGTLLLFALVLPALGARDLATKYTYRQVLCDSAEGSYILYWSFDTTEESISFAVNVSTTGWVGFGISPNGGMPGSDVVIGWVDSGGNPQFNDRFADELDLPSVDSSQDWMLLSAEEENGFTILEFTRSFITCDDKDLDIGFDTSRVIWSWSMTEPPQTKNPHQFRGVTSLNLLGSLETPVADPEDLEFFDATVNNATIPSSRTTYWCASLQLPAEVQNNEKYITHISPVITGHVRKYVHHILIYLCPNQLSRAVIGASAPCLENPITVRKCQRGLVFGGWAIGGEGFVYPENVAFPIGGPEGLSTAVIEIHYDNPDLDENVTDSSGLRFFYTSTPREHRAGVFFLGHTVTDFMIIPPNANSYTIAGLCHQNCTQSYLPENGVKIFGNFLHTHVAGTGLLLQHFRWNDQCDMWEELPPIDQNLHYDFNFQQFTHLGREVTVLPGDLIILKCFYTTVEKDNVTTGGDSTDEEMCLSFPVYYPETRLDRCLSFPEVPNGFQHFIDDHLTSPSATALLSQGRLVDASNTLEWNSEQIEALQETVLTSPLGVFCSSKDQDQMLIEDIPGLPSVDQICSHQPVDKCTATEPLSTCCTRAKDGALSLSVTRTVTLIVLGTIATLYITHI